MCVILYKPYDVDVPSRETLHKCWQRNPDGAGYAWLRSDERWDVRKGFLKWKKFWKAYKNEGFTKDHCIIIHFRIKTAGKINQGNTHPFIVTNDYAEMRKTNFVADEIVFHNGVIGAGEGSASDTMLFIKDKLDPLTPYLADEKIKKLYDNLIMETNSRWLIANKTMITKYGTWSAKDGIDYSNLLWDYTPPATNKRTYNIVPYYNNRTDDYYQVMEGDKTGTVMNDGHVVWDISSTEDNDKIIMCPFCYEDKYIIESPFQGMGDSMCERCGCCFDEGTDEMFMFDEEIKSAYDARRANQAQGNA